eukprot:851253-Prorocentrum_lima.AAC.1
MHAAFANEPILLAAEPPLRCGPGFHREPCSEDVEMPLRQDRCACDVEQQWGVGKDGIGGNP